MAIVAGAGRSRALVRNRRPCAMPQQFGTALRKRRWASAWRLALLVFLAARGDAPGRVDRWRHRCRPHAGPCPSRPPGITPRCQPLLALFCAHLGRDQVRSEARSSGWAWRKTSVAATPPRWRPIWESPDWGRPSRSAIHCPARWYAVVVAAALAEATADTLASELGEVLGGQPLMVTTLRRVAPGTDGAISLAGTVAGSGGAVLVVLVAALTLGLESCDAVCAGLGAVGGLFVDSLLGATAERRGWLNNDAVNFLPPSRPL